jgi:hypothetical protein
VRAQFTAHHDHKTGQREQRDGGADGATRGAEVALGEGEHGRRDQQIRHDERQFADEQRGDGGERARPSPPSQRTRDSPGHDRDGQPVPDRHQERPATWPDADAKTAR